MPAKIIIDGVIGWDVYPRSIRRQLDDADGGPVDIELASPGGFVYDGLEISNILRDYNEKVNKVDITIKGLAASMASIIALSVPKQQRHAEDNAIFMIHNVWGYTVGDYREMEKTAKEFNSLTNLLAQTYVKATGMSLPTVRQLMDDETWYYGSEILDNGFVNDIIEHGGEDNIDKETTLAMGKSKFISAMDQISKDKNEIKKDLSKAAAMIGEVKPSNKIQNPASAGIKQTEVKRMTLDELKKDHPDLYAQVVQIGKDQEFDRVNAHILLGTQAGCLDIAAKNISEKKEFSQSVSAEYMAAGMKNRSLQDRVEDDPGAINVQAQEDEPAETQAYANKLLAQRGVKNGK